MPLSGLHRNPAKTAARPISVCGFAKGKARLTLHLFEFLFVLFIIIMQMLLLLLLLLLLFFNWFGEPE